MSLPIQTRETNIAMASEATGIHLVDCDVHAGVNSLDELMPYLPNVWQHYLTESGFKGPPPTPYPKVKPFAARNDAHPPSGRLPGTDFSFFQKHHLDHWQIDRTIINPLYAVDCLPNIDFGGALCTALNDYMIENWYERDERMYGSILIPWQDPEQAVREIERVGSHRKVVQIILFVCAGALYGQRRFHSIWKAAESQNLAVGIHWGSAGATPMPTGDQPSYYLEYHTVLAQSAMSQIVSFVCEGVFEKFPQLRVVLIEGGSAWLPSLMWRLDKDWRGCRMEVPWLTRPPSEYIRSNVRLTTQPIEEPEDPNHLVQVMEHMGSDRMLLFSTDYPHWDFDSPARAIPQQVPEPLRQNIFWKNALDFYDLQ